MTYSNVDKRKQRKPPPGHPWATWKPGWLRIDPRHGPAPTTKKENKR